MAGCKSNQPNAVPGDLATASHRIDLAAVPGEYKPVDRQILDALTRAHGESAAKLDPTGPHPKKLQILALSGGGKFGAYSAGVVCGWTSTSKRPSFDVVTGVSTGSLVALYAFLGPEYDARLHELYTTMRTRDVIRRKPLMAAAWSDSVASSAPLARLIREEMTEEKLAQVAAAHARGRRLFVGTTNIDTKRLTIWDMGAIASGQRPDKLVLFQEILLASCSVPVGMPPVKIAVTYNGQAYTERHVDGGATSQLFVRGSLLQIDPTVIKAGHRPLEGSDLYLVVAGKLYADPVAVKPRVMDIASGAASSLIYAQTRNDLIRLYTLALVGGMNYHLAALAQDVPVSEDSLSFKPEEMRALFNAGYEDGRTPKRWRDAPPEVDSDHQSLPRAGTDFLTPFTVPGTP
jgi:hypothetical protein